MAASGLEGDEETERLSVGGASGGTAAEESAKVLWACKRLLNDNKRAVRSISSCKITSLFSLNSRGSVEEWLSFTAQG